MIQAARTGVWAENQGIEVVILLAKEGIVAKEPEVSPLQSVILAVLREFPHGLPRTKLIKLLYFVDYIYYQTAGRTFTGIQYRWDHYGPNATNLEIVKDAKMLQEQGLLTITQERNDYPGTDSGKRYRYRLAADIAEPELDPIAAYIMRDIIRKYRRSSVSEIAEASKQTPPFERARQGQVLDFEAQGAPYRERVDGEPLSEQQLAGLRHDPGKTMEQVLQKHGLAASWAGRVPISPWCGGFS